MTSEQEEVQKEYELLQSKFKFNALEGCDMRDRLGRPSWVQVTCLDHAPGKNSFPAQE